MIPHVVFDINARNNRGIELLKSTFMCASNQLKIMLRSQFEGSDVGYILSCSDFCVDYFCYLFFHIETETSETFDANSGRASKPIDAIQRHGL